MDPLTHMVTGALVAQSLAPEEHRWLTALVAAGAAVVPDLDFLARKAPQKLLFLKLHRGLTHSLLAVPLIAACAAGSGHLLFGLPFSVTFAVCALAAASHLVLDAVMHSTGLQLLWPWSRRLRLPLLIGLNPLTSSARCAERSLGVCLRCTMHSAVLSPLVLLLWVGFLISLFGPYPETSRLTLAAGVGYLAVTLFMRLAARVALHRHLRRSHDPVKASGVFPASFSPFRWLGVVQRVGGFEVLTIHPLTVQVALLRRFGPTEQGADVDRGRDTPSVIQFLDNAVFPHVARSGRNLIWRDLAFAFSDVVSLFAVRVTLDGNRVVREEFRERWDVPLEHPDS
jgi:membrane-bound metal-dependent hydrolase YbcI (DUF457 family)